MNRRIVSLNGGLGFAYGPSPVPETSFTYVNQGLDESEH
jgi:hypothetical protein